MAKLTLTDVVAGYAVVSAYNDNNTAIETALENTLSRDGTAPNAMGAVLDMSTHQINNLSDGTLATDAVNLRQLQGQVAAPAGAIPSQTGHAGKHLKTDGTVTSWNDIASSYMDTVLPAATAAAARTLFGTQEFFNVKDTAYGAIGDGATNDTAAINLAIAAANAANTSASKAVTLYFPPGIYLITPGGLSTINTSISAPGATVRASSNTNSPIILFDDLAYGRDVDIYSIVGPNYGTTWQTAANQYGIGFRVLRGEHSTFKFHRLEGLYVAADYAGHVNEQHIGECSFEAQSILHNNYGVNLNAGDAQCEANRFTIAYFSNNLTSVLLRNYGSNANSLCANNHFDILVMEFPTAGGIGFDLSGDVPAQTLSNSFIIRENIAPNGTATVVTDGGGTTLGCNYFRFSDFDFAKMSVVSKQVFDGSAEFSQPGTTTQKARSVTFGSAAPTTRYWEVGAIRWNNAPVVGGNLGWICVVAGSPGTWATIGSVDLQGSAAWNPGSIAAGAREQKDITVTGAALGDFAIGSFSADLLNLNISASVNSANLVSVTLANNTGGAIDLAAGTVYAKVIKK